MTNPSKIFQLGILAAVVLFGVNAHATPPTPLPPPPRAPLPQTYADPAVELQLTGDEPMVIRVVALKGRGDPEYKLFTCRTPCRVRVLPGKYRFHVKGGRNKIEASRVVEVEGHERLHFSLPEKGEKGAALATAITGTALIPVGFMVMLANACFDCDSETSRKRETPTGTYIGLGMFVAGAVLTPLGWSAFARSRKVGVEEVPLGSERQAAKNERGRVQFGVAPTRGGATAGFWGTF